MAGWSGGRSWCVAAVAVLLAASTACGARWSDEERAAVAARSDRSGVATPSVAAASVGAPTSVPGAAPGAGGAAGDGTGGPGGVGPAAVPGGSAGDGADHVGPAGAAVAGGARPCAAPSDAPGISEAEIAVGAINSLTGPVPGLGTSALAATQAYVAFRNATGGVCGRRIVLRAADDGADSARNRSLVRELAPQVLGFVGGIAGGDDGGAVVIREQGIPFLGNSISSSLRTETPTYFGVNMPVVDPLAANGKFRFLREQGITRAALVYSSPAVGEAQGQRPQLEAAGIRVVLDLALPITTLSYDSAARAVANSGAQYMLFVHEQGASAAMARALAAVDHDLAYPEYIAAYGNDFVDLAASAAEGATSWLYTLPIEDAGTNGELDTFLEWMGRAAPGAALDTFASVAWAAAKVFFETLESIPGPITRQALVDRAAATERYDAGGMLAPVLLSAKRSEGCLVGVVVRHGAWRRLAPADGFLC